MKKALLLLMSAIMITALIGCGNQQEPNHTAATNPAASESEAPHNKTEPTENQASAQEQKYTFHYQDTEIALHADAAPILKALGEPKSYTEEASCAFVGKDKTYYYGNFYMQTYPKDDKDFVYCLWFTDDTVTTDEGISIGSSKAEVESVYGKDSFNGKNAYVLSGATGNLTIILKEDVVSSIQYMAKVS